MGTMVACCNDHDYKQYSSEWYNCIDSQVELDDKSSDLIRDMEYIPADVAYDLRGGATSDYEWFGDDPYGDWR